MLIGKIQKGRKNMIEYSWILLRPALCNSMLWSQPWGQNILDLVLTSDENMIETLSVGEHFNISDHQVVRWGIVMEQTQEVKANVKRPNFFKADYDLVRNKLKEKNLESAVRGTEMNDAWKKLNGIMRKIIENNIPNYKKTNKKRPWVTREVQKKRRARQKGWKKF